MDLKSIIIITCLYILLLLFDYIYYIASYMIFYSNVK